MEMTRSRWIQDQIGYDFKHEGLLCQAFTRRSYTEENKNAPHNENLEFYGDRALEIVISKKMSEYFGMVDENGCYVSLADEGELTEIKKRLVCKKMLASKICAYGFQNDLRMGWGDCEQRAWQQESVQEDLFEAIIGAVAIDSNWDMLALTKVVDLMLDPDSHFKNSGEDFDYVTLIQQWCQKKYGCLPQYAVRNGCWNPALLQKEFDGSDFQCDLTFGPFAFPFQALGKSKKSAKKAAAKEAYRYLKKNNLLLSLVDEVGKPDFDRAVNQLQELHQKKYISEPQYAFEESHDENGNPLWTYRCRVESIGMEFSITHASKKHAKKEAAYHIVWLYLGEVDASDATDD